MRGALRRGDRESVSMIQNVPEFSVSDISRALKQTVETSFSHVRVRGELSRVTLAKSGHLYSDLKDESSVLNIVCWRGSVQKLSIKPEEGMEVICIGRMTTFPGSSRYQLVVESMELAGEGALLKLLEDRKKKLAAEGLFDEDRKIPLPFLPKTIGVVTSPTGAVIRDIIHRVSDRFPCRVMVWPVQVQGVGADAQVAQGIEGFNKASDRNRPDLIIVARGGGSLEDLMAFNEENVVRAVAASTIPVISAVGHETDTTLIDYVSDRRAPTPTGAAEMAVPVIDSIWASVDDYRARLKQSLKRLIETYTQTLHVSSRVLDHPHRLIEPLEQRYDTVSHKLDNAFIRNVDVQDKKLLSLGGRLKTPQSVLDQGQLSLDNLFGRMKQAGTRIIPERTDKVSGLDRMLETLSYKSILNRGYAVLHGEDGQLLDDVDAIQSAEKIKVTVKDGSVTR
jgi:exodeoxyribonuclease VII large subunit